MDLPDTYKEKFSRPRARKIGEPRSERDELIAKFADALNKECEKDGFPPYSYARLAHMFRGRDDHFLYKLFRDCSEPGVRKFGALMRSKLYPKKA